MSRLALLLLTVLAMAVGCSDGQAAPIQNLVVLPAPDPAQAVHFPPGTATAGVAAIGPALDRVDITTHDCSPLNPCALATPAISDAALPKPRQQVGERQRVRRPG